VPARPDAGGRHIEYRSSVYLNGRLVDKRWLDEVERLVVNFLAEWYIRKQTEPLVTDLKEGRTC
jgi:hypothetical protein